MANHEHVAILDKGVAEWNDWRFKNPKVDPDLSGHYFNDRDFKGVNFGKCNVKRCQFHFCGFSNAQFVDAAMDQTVFAQCELVGANFSVATMKDVIMNHCNVEKGVFRYATCVNMRFSKSQLRATIFSQMDLSSSKFEECDIKGAHFTDANASSVSFRFCVVDGETIFQKCVFDQFADCTGTGMSVVRMEPEVKSQLERNVRAIYWREWYKKHPIGRHLMRLFWMLSDYGNSMARIVITFFVIALIYAGVYFVSSWRTHSPAIMNLCTIVDQGHEAMLPAHVCVVRAVYFSVVTMTTIGFGDVLPSPFSTIGHLLVITQVMIGYLILAALVTRLGIMFQSVG